MTGTTSGDTSQGVSNLYVFKSRLQEFAQKVGLPTPTYETRKDGPSHEPTFQSTVILKDVRYDSLTGFYNRKAAEQSAAEIALLALSRSSNAAPFISQPAHETGLCKNLLQEYAQKMNHAIPLYECKRDETSGRIPMYSCTVEIGGMKYIGCAAKTKKEAEIKAARTAMLAIQGPSSSSSSSHLDGQSNLTVIPIKKKLSDSGTPAKDPATKALKPRRRQFKRKPRNNMNAADGGRSRNSKNTSQMQSVDCNQSSTGLVDANVSANADADADVSANADANVSANADTNVSANADTNVDAHVNVNANANVDPHVNGNEDGNGNGNGNVDASVNGNGNGNVDAIVNVNEVTPLKVYTPETPEESGLQKRFTDAPSDPCSNTESDGNGNGIGGNSSCSLSNDVNLLPTSSN